MGLSAVVSAGLAAGFLGLGRRLALGEGGRLALAGAGRLVELATQALVLGLQVAEAPLERLAVGTEGRFHTSIVRRSQTCSCDSGGQSMDQFELGVAIKYVLVTA